MYVGPSIGRFILSRAIGSVFVIATAVIICIIKEEFNERRQKKMGSHILSERSFRGQCGFEYQRGTCDECGRRKRND